MTPAHSTSEVGRSFLAELEGWRRALARDIAARNTFLDSDQLDVVVQETIGRIVFLRIAEARGIEVSGQLRSLLNGPDIYGELEKLFRRAGARYNSGLFDFRGDVILPDEADELAPSLRVGDDAL